MTNWNICGRYIMWKGFSQLEHFSDKRLIFRDFVWTSFMDGMGVSSGPYSP